ncbi:NAD(P)/FAD-dependent oxidoreductase [uncultured Methanoregula sp.]|uniref:NAD(P)/FAD-dependent oxidoreductase n=1 Tax=uncultured Methanoregula sp. TaxID=1005933 RepID=UPI002AAB3ECD|nr:NAD(P)/FAD-dependent oxidoreductase [uncultured Methanoregula sp.]
MIYDVVIAGAGPTGSAAAEECARLGLTTLCIEEHGTIGHPVQCAGLLSNAAFAECRVSGRPVLNRVTGARIFAGNEKSILIDAKRIMACVVDRCALDREMAEHAANRGAEFRLRTSVSGIRGNTLLTRGVNGDEEIPFRILIAADGPRSSIARYLKMERARLFLAGIQADIPCESDTRYVGLYPDAAPDFFGWAIPVTPGITRIGMCTGSHVPERFEEFRKRFGDNCLHLVTGTLPLGVMPRTYGNRALFVGDAAGFAKPTSGGGIYTGIRSARHAAKVAAEACGCDRYDDSVLARYEQYWQADFGSELELGFRLLGMRQRMTSGDVNDIIAALDDPDIIRTIEEYGDMDRPGIVVKKLLFRPGMLRLLGPLLATGLRSFL